MKFSIISIFPEIVETFTKYGLIAKAIEKKIIDIDIYNLRDFSENKHQKVDDRPFGGGPGMVMTPEPFFNAICFIKKKRAGRVILFSAYAKVLTQKKVKTLAKEDHLILACGRYEGVDQRVIDECIDEEISTGRYVLMGGEVPAQVLIESISRMLEGVVGNRESVESDSFYYNNQFDFPQFTQPRNYKGFKVPDVLLSGDHKLIDKWRKKNQKSNK